MYTHVYRYFISFYSILRFQNAYLCDEHAQFIHKCITKFEEMATQMKVDAILKFIERYLPNLVLFLV